MRKVDGNVTFANTLKEVVSSNVVGPSDRTSGTAQSRKGIVCSGAFILRDRERQGESRDPGESRRTCCCFSFLS